MTYYRNFTLSQWLVHLENRYQQEICLGLTRIKKVAEILQLLQPQAYVISVAGTNGKGSTVAALEAIYSSAGYLVASYTSPHLLFFNERIRVNQVAITDEDLCRAFSIVEEARGDLCLTYFEMTTLAALWYFKQQNLDLIILEVGLGGRLDATNIIDASLAIITTIAFDHELFLGSTLDAIGNEKAGILKAGISCIFADTTLPVSIKLRAQELKCRLYCFGSDYNYELNESQSLWQFRFASCLLKLPKTCLHYKAVSAAIMATICLKLQLPIKAKAVVDGVAAVFLAGRLQLIKGEVSTLYDVSHNPQAAMHLSSYLKTLQVKAVHAVFSAFKDKDIEGIITPLFRQVNYWYLARLPGKRGALDGQLKAPFRSHRIVEPICYNTPIEAYQEAKVQAEPGDLIIVYGSFLTVAIVMDSLGAVK